jgi:hypothetical protein
VCDAEFKHPDGSKTRWHKVFATKGEADCAEAYYRATGNVPPSMVVAPTESYTAVAERFATKNAKWLDAHRSNPQRLQWSVDFLGKLDIKMIRTRQLEDYIDHLMKRAGRAGKAPENSAP